MKRDFRVVEDIGMKMATLSIFSVMILVTANTIGRYFLNESISWSIPVIELYLMGAIIFLSAAKIQEIGGNVSTTAFVDRIPNELRRYLLAIANVATIVFLCLITWGTAKTALNRWELGASTTASVPLPTAFSWVIVSTGILLLTIRMVLETYSLFDSDDPFDDSDLTYADEELVTGEN